ncbi:alkaline phosphatase family protein [Bauldia litoralis]|uniref:Predicted pyrophosphatase or phosphodiesterase, AlkP superfamily n=1 Tax=Bauldia litoralis TaxID=665467 RepID=A0A1G6B0D2_9HYPH|nr:alkaline phosphatase family protein [Bauldia litoralis]SDB14042.1 Predicted pyrophosphatase or phosphodiesterase, AlkP superfamily [Bauldia litoralis]
MCRVAAVAAIISLANVAGANAQESEARPKLVLQLTVDQLRGDLIERYSAGLGDNGFRYLLDNGSVFTNAHHRHANTETIVGHTTLATGTDPAIHGMVANVWFDRKTGAPRYNVQDDRYPLVGEGGVDAATEIDPTQRAATTDGRSPAAILTSTISDEIALAMGPTAKIFGVSVKDRGAIAMAGHAGKAYWFSKSEGAFITSTFYRDTYPDWVVAWNEKGMPASYADTSWQLMLDRSLYTFGTADDVPWETDFPGFGRTFPHPYGAADSKYFTTLLTLSPAGDEITLDFAKALIDAEQVGQDEVTDYLSVSFSSTDYVGHIFGPSSLESEDNIKRLDRTIADLLAFVDERVGLDRTLIVLSADHGAPEVPGYLATLGIEASYFDFAEVDKQPAVKALKDEFGIAEDLVADFSQPYVYLNDAVIDARGLDKAEVESFLAEELRKMPGIAFAFSSIALRSGNIASTAVSEAVLANFNAERSGDIYVVFEPHWFVADFDGLSVASAHGSPWTYDTYVPLIVAGPRILSQRIARPVETVDVAPTIASYLRIKPPTGSRGVPLIEALPR